jgi:hypothetical protein
LTTILKPGSLTATGRHAAGEVGKALREAAFLHRNYLLSDLLPRHGALAATTLRHREDEDFNLSFSHAESEDGYRARLGLWLEDFGLRHLHENGRIFFFISFTERTCFKSMLLKSPRMCQVSLSRNATAS